MVGTSVSPVFPSRVVIQSKLYQMQYDANYIHVLNSNGKVLECASPILSKEHVKCASPISSKEHVKCASPISSKEHVKCAAPISSKEHVKCASPVSSKEHFKCVLCTLFPELYSFCSIQHYHRRKGTFSGVPRKLEFTNENSTDGNNSNGNTIEETKKNSSIKDFSITTLLKRFPTEDYHNAINSFIKNNDSGDSSYLLDSDSGDTGSGYSVLDFLENINNSPESNQNIRHKDVHPFRFDFLRELNERNCFSVLSCILSFISDEDVRKVNNVCKEWREIVSSDKRATERLKAYIKKKKDCATGSQKENKTCKKTPERGHKSAFFALTNSPVELTPPPLHHSQSLGRFDCFIEEAKKLQKEDVMIKCPKCCYPSRAESEKKNCCSRTLCQHVFCSTCLSPHQDEHLCSEPKLNTALLGIKVGSKQSKRNLRRL